MACEQAAGVSVGKRTGAGAVGAGGQGDLVGSAPAQPVGGTAIRLVQEAVVLTARVRSGELALYGRIDAS